MKLNDEDVNELLIDMRRNMAMLLHYARDKRAEGRRYKAAQEKTSSEVGVKLDTFDWYAGWLRGASSGARFSFRLIMNQYQWITRERDGIAFTFSTEGLPRLEVVTVPRFSPAQGKDER